MLRSSENATETRKLFEEMVRTETAAYYHANVEAGLPVDKKPAPGLSVNESTVVVYGEGSLLEWCKVNAPNFLTVDKAAFEQWAKVAHKEVLPPFVLVKKEGKASIATDLPKAFETAGVEWREPPESEAVA